MVGGIGGDGLSEDEIDVTPTRALFVEMLTRDILLDRAVLDLVDNSVDGAKRLRPGPDSSFEGLEIRISMDGDRFEIADNCGGVGIDNARRYAFRFGRPAGMPETPGSVGQFGVGMKRALFKFGHRFEVDSATLRDRFALRVDVDEWERQTGPWRFAFDVSETDLDVPVADTGTTISVAPLRRDAAAQFGNATFRNQLARQIEATQQQYIDRDLRIVFEGRTLLATPWKLLAGQGIEPMMSEDAVEVGSGVVHRRIYAGIGRSSPQEAGWYVFCNGRMILAADQTRVTGWERGDDAQGVTLPKFHGQFARFRGFVFFDAEDASLLPWNTTKTGVDVDMDVWRATQAEMRRAMRPVLDFLNRLDSENGEGSERVLGQAVARAQPIPLRTMHRRGPFVFPTAPPRPKAPPTTSIQFSRLRDQVDALKAAYDASTNSELGGMLFDEAYGETVGD